VHLTENSSHTLIVKGGKKLSIHLNKSDHQHLLEVVTKLQEYHSISSHHASGKAVIGVYRALLHALDVFQINDGIESYLRPMLAGGYQNEADLKQLIEERIANTKPDEERSADFPLRCLLDVMKRGLLTSYQAEHSMLEKVKDKITGHPTRKEMLDHEEKLLEPIAHNLADIVDEYIRAQ
jgi:hypothetical protein